MTEKTFLGYERPNGYAGARNYVLIMPINRSLNFIASNVAKMTRGTRHFEIPAETGRPAKDRETIARTMAGLMNNPNVGCILLMAVKPSSSSAYRNMSDVRFIEEAKKTGKPWRIVYLTEAGGSYALLGETLRVARELIVEASAMRRTPCPLSKLAVAVKCGTSDATSGIAGNPCVGAAFDRIVKAGGTAFWSETTEIIGAEDIVAARAASPEVSAKILAAAARWEEKARSTGEDIREINPIPANIAAGISTLEEKSLGAIAKSGSCPIEDVLDYGEQPKGHGLYFIDSWMSRARPLPDGRGRNAQPPDDARDQSDGRLPIPLCDGKCPCLFAFSRQFRLRFLGHHDEGCAHRRRGRTTARSPDRHRFRHLHENGNARLRRAA